MFQDLIRRSIETGFWPIRPAAQLFIKFGLCKVRTNISPYAAKNRPGSDDGRFGAVDKQTRPKYVKATAEI